MHSVVVILHPEVGVSVTVNVARSEDEALIQDRTGEAVSANDDDDLNAVQELIEELDVSEDNLPSETEAEDQAKAATAAQEAAEKASEEESAEVAIDAESEAKQ
jgi:large subunit ribosomal protein L9